MISKQHQKKLQAALVLLTEDTTTYKKFEKIRTLVKGVNPEVDNLLDKCSRSIKGMKAFQKGDVLHLSSEAAKVLPEETEKQKKRKKAILAFIKNFKKIRSKVKKVLKAFDGDGDSDNVDSSSSSGGEHGLLSSLKGPLVALSVIGVVVAGALVFLKNSSVEVVINNQGCDPMTPVVTMPVSIPGLRLPTETIVDGGSATAEIPPLTFTVDGSSGTSIVLTTFTFTMTFGLGEGGTDVVFDGESLVGKRTTIRLGDSPSHQLTIVCQ